MPILFDKMERERSNYECGIVFHTYWLSLDTNRFEREIDLCVVIPKLNKSNRVQHELLCSHSISPRPLSKVIKYCLPPSSNVHFFTFQLPTSTRTMTAFPLLVSNKPISFSTLRLTSRHSTPISTSPGPTAFCFPDIH